MLSQLLIGVKRVFNPAAWKEDEVDNVPEEDVIMDRDDSSDSDVEVVSLAYSCVIW